MDESDPPRRRVKKYAGDIDRTGDIGEARIGLRFALESGPDISPRLIVVALAVADESFKSPDGDEVELKTPLLASSSLPHKDEASSSRGGSTEEGEKAVNPWFTPRALDVEVELLSSLLGLGLRIQLRMCAYSLSCEILARLAGRVLMLQGVNNLSDVWGHTVKNADKSEREETEH